MNGDCTYNETCQCLARALVVVDHTDAALPTRVEVIEPHGLVHILREHGDSEDGDRGAVACVAEARVEAIDSNVCVMRGCARRRERVLRRGMVAQRD